MDVTIVHGSEEVLPGTDEHIRDQMDRLASGICGRIGDDAPMELLDGDTTRYQQFGTVVIDNGASASYAFGVEFNFSIPTFVLLGIFGQIDNQLRYEVIMHLGSPAEAVASEMLRLVLDDLLFGGGEQEQIFSSGFGMGDISDLI